MEKEFVKLEIKKDKDNIIKIDHTDDIDDDNPIMCGQKEEEVPKKKGMKKGLCYKCKVNKPQYSNRGEFICK